LTDTSDVSPRDAQERPARYSSTITDCIMSRQMQNEPNFLLFLEVLDSVGQ